MHTDHALEVYRVDLPVLGTLLVLQTQDFRVSQEKEPCIRVNTRELNGVSSTKLSTLYYIC